VPIPDIETLGRHASRALRRATSNQVTTKVRAFVVAARIFGPMPSSVCGRGGRDFP
jgi:hypothetical protein